MILISILSYLLVLLIGIGIGYILNKKKLETELQNTKSQLKNYQDTINDHIYKTQKIMDNIYSQFRELKKHSDLYSVHLNSQKLKTMISHDEQKNSEERFKDHMPDIDQK